MTTVKNFVLEITYSKSATSKTLEKLKNKNLKKDKLSWNRELSNEFLN